MNELDDTPPWLTVLVVVSLIGVFFWSFRNVPFDWPKGGRLKRFLRGQPREE